MNRKSRTIAEREAQLERRLATFEADQIVTSLLCGDTRLPRDCETQVLPARDYFFPGGTRRRSSSNQSATARSLAPAASPYLIDRNRSPSDATSQE